MSSLDVCFIIFLVITGFAVSSGLAIFCTSVLTRGNGPYYQNENGGYVVYKYMMSRGSGKYQAYRFRQDGDKLVYLKEKTSFPIFETVVFAVIFICFSILTGIIPGIIIVVCLVLGYFWLVYVVRTYNVIYCRRFLKKKLKI